MICDHRHQAEWEAIEEKLATIEAAIAALFMFAALLAWLGFTVYFLHLNYSR